MATAVEKLHPNVRFVSEIGGEDMKTIFFSGNADSKSKQVLMQSACSGGTGTFIEKTARRLQISSEQLSQMRYSGYTLQKISSKCGIFAEADANTLLKAGVKVELRLVVVDTQEAHLGRVSAQEALAVLLRVVEVDPRDPHAVLDLPRGQVVEAHGPGIREAGIT